MTAEPREREGWKKGKGEPSGGTEVRSVSGAGEEKGEDTGNGPGDQTVRKTCSYGLGSSWVWQAANLMKSVTFPVLCCFSCCDASCCVPRQTPSAGPHQFPGFQVGLIQNSLFEGVADHLGKFKFSR